MRPITTAIHLASWALFIALILLVQSLSAQTTGQNVLQKKNSGAGFTLESFTLSNGQLIGRTSGGTLSGITLGTGLTLSGTTLSSSASGGTLASLTDVTLTSPANNQLLRYNSASSKWVNWTPDFLVPADLASYLPITSAADATANSLTLTETLSTPQVGVTNGGIYSSNLWPNQLDFEDSSTGFSVTLLPPTSGTLAANANITLPSTTGTLLTSGSTLNGANLTNGTITNAKLATPSMTINGIVRTLGDSFSVAPAAPLTLAGGTVTTSSPPLTLTQTWNAGAQVFNASDINITSTNGSTHAAGSTLQRWMISGTPVLSIASNTTTGTDASNWRLVFGADASIGWSASWGAVTIRNAANSAAGNLRAGVLQATSGVFGTNYVSLGTGSEGDVQLSSASWRGAGLRMRNTGTITWTTGTDATSAADIIIDIGTVSPEGSVTANPGSIYLRNNSGTGEMWLKTSGTGNTGWTLK